MAYGDPFRSSSGSMLDAPPPAPPPMTKPGDDTTSLLGGLNTNPAGGASVNTPMGRVLRGLSSLMMGINDIEGVVPGSIPPPMLQIVTQLTQTLPEVVRQMTTTPGPQSLMLAAQSGAMPGAQMGMLNQPPSANQSGMEGMMASRM